MQSVSSLLTGLSKFHILKKWSCFRGLKIYKKWICSRISFWLSDQQSKYKKIGLTKSEDTEWRLKGRENC